MTWPPTKTFGVYYNICSSKTKASKKLRENTFQEKYKQFKNLVMHVRLALSNT